VGQAQIEEAMKEKDLENRFSYAWNVYREIIPLHRKQFLGWITPLDLDFFKGKSFLDAGCGIGRNSLWPLEAGAAKAHAFDCNEATVAVARRNLERFPNCTVACRSIYDLEELHQYDVAFSIGVVHHLKDPRRAVKNLVGSIRPGGTLILWVYAREGNENYLRWAEPLRRLLTSRLPPDSVRIIAKPLTFLLRLYLLFPHRQEYLRLLRERSFRHIEAMVFDQLLPGVSHYWRREEVLSLIDGLPVRPIHMTHTHGMSWTLIARKT
jgi:SAM-dependent methyltransferase